MNKYTIYVGSLLLYNGFGAWFDAKNKLIQYREDKLNKYERDEIKDQWSAVKYGANENSNDRFFESVIWPVKAITNIIPFIVLQLNPPPSMTGTNNKTSSTDKEK